ncbi:SDR family oxidoreductase [Paenibacillus thiaminolyticus]|uniref:SDR family oxidoreductase n=1 Tax=Paenibacillus thiaminolyticus TaxID=49283 RepID=UPI001603D363|nr:SDR family oxidoreductase [Paenibacillus thiaminolyticus]
MRLFMDAGANVVIADYNEEAGMRLLNDLGPSAAERAFFVACNVADSASVQQLMEKTLKRFGAIEWTTGRGRAGLFVPCVRRRGLY